MRIGTEEISSKGKCILP